MFDEKDVFPFYINDMPYLDSNILSKIFNASVSLEILYIATDNNRSDYDKMLIFC